jgi:DNA repair protein RadC
LYARPRTAGFLRVGEEQKHTAGHERQTSKKKLMKNKNLKEEQAPANADQQASNAVGTAAAKPAKYHLPEVKIARLREVQIDNPILDNPENAAEFWRENVPNAAWFDQDAESFVVLLLNTRKKIIGFTRGASGTLDTILITPREVFKAAMVQGAASILLMHNHPSGDPSPSEADIKVTRDLIRAGQLLKIEILDHVIIGDKTDTAKGYTSLRELGYFYN